LGNGQVDLREATEKLQHRLMEEALRLSNGNKSAAARMLGLKRTTLVAKLRRKSRSNGRISMLASEAEESLSACMAAGSGKER
jgi:DNA-binding NtrC family response regulator